MDQERSRRNKVVEREPQEEESQERKSKNVGVEGEKKSCRKKRKKLHKK